MIGRVLGVAAIIIVVLASWSWLAPPTIQLARSTEPVIATAPTTAAIAAPLESTGSNSPSVVSPAPTASADATTARPAIVFATPSGPIALDALRISIPRLGIDLPLAYGDLERDVPRPGYAGDTPERVALVFPGSAPINSGGNTYIYAHARVGMFLSLWNAQVDDEVDIYVAAAPRLRFLYRVSRVLPRVDPNDTSWLDPRGPEHLTLQTSTGPYPTDPRFIVVAVPVQSGY